jgi:AraC family transcriptional regulator
MPNTGEPTVLAQGAEIQRERLPSPHTPVLGHADQKYANGERLREPMQSPTLRVERWRHEGGVQNDLLLECNEIAILLSGRTYVRRTGDGRRQEGHARVGSAWICPAGTFEREVEVSGPGEWLHIFLPTGLLEHSALANYDIDPSGLQLAYKGGFVDPLIVQFSRTFSALLDQGMGPADRLLVDGMNVALVARLVAEHTIERRSRLAQAPILGMKRLSAVLEYIDANLGSDLRLDELARVACLSPFHFARRFKEATGVTPHRYVLERRIQAALGRLEKHHSSLAEVALDCGFGSQAHFTRVFRRHTGLTPGDYRAANARLQQSSFRQ